MVEVEVGGLITTVPGPMVVCVFVTVTSTVVCGTVGSSVVVVAALSVTVSAPVLSAALPLLPPNAAITPTQKSAANAPQNGSLVLITLPPDLRSCGEDAEAPERRPVPANDRTCR